MEVSFRFYAQLNDFLPPRWRYGRFRHALRAPAPVKDVIEALGVPHPEVDVITANGEATDLTYRVRNDDHVCVYPVFRKLDLGGLRRVGTDPPRPIRFALDVHLRKLASLLRLAGFDAVMLIDDAELAERSAAEGRVALTRDVGLLKRTAVRHGRWIRHTDPELQLLEVLDRYDLAGQMTPFVRCMECNTLLVPAALDAIAERLPAGTRECFSEFHRCPGCDRIYWRGSHYDRLLRLLERARTRLGGIL